MLPIITQKQLVDVPQTFSIFWTCVVLECFMFFSSAIVSSLHPLPTQFTHYLPLISSHALPFNSFSLSVLLLRSLPSLSSHSNNLLNSLDFFFFYNEVVIAGYQPAISVCDLSQLFVLFIPLSFSFFFLSAKCA